jgi:hypothetical protein
MDRRIAYAANVVLFLPTVILHGFVGSLLWRWFAVPSGAPDLGMKVMSGMCLLFTLMYPKSLPDREPLGAKREGVYLLREFLLKRGLVPLFILLLGFALHKMRMP